MKTNMKKWIVRSKLLIYLLIGLVPAVVFKLYASPESTYDSAFSILIWLSLVIIDSVQSKEEDNK